MPEPPTFVSFLSDFGRGDESVGVCHAVMLELAPHLRIVDITHEIAPFDVRAGALALVRSVQYLPAGVVLAVVDPGAGTDRRLIGVEVENGYLLGPDNGLLAPAVAMVGGPRRVVELRNPDYRLPAPGPTFAGRDVLAPAAGHLGAGVALEAMGPEIDPVSLAPGLLPLPQDDEGRLRAQVLWVDRFGNCQLNLGPDDLAARGVQPGGAVEVHFRDEVRRARWVGAYADARPSELVVVVDAHGLLSLSTDRRSAAVECGLRAGDAVVVVTPDTDGGAGAGPVPGTGAGVTGEPGEEARR